MPVDSLVPLPLVCVFPALFSSVSSTTLRCSAKRKSIDTLTFFIKRNRRFARQGNRPRSRPHSRSRSPHRSHPLCPPINRPHSHHANRPLAPRFSHQGNPRCSPRSSRRPTPPRCRRPSRPPAPQPRRRLSPQWCLPRCPLPRPRRRQVTRRQQSLRTTPQPPPLPPPRRCPRRNPRHCPPQPRQYNKRTLKAETQPEIETSPVQLGCSTNTKYPTLSPRFQPLGMPWMHAPPRALFPAVVATPGEDKLVLLLLIIISPNQFCVCTLLSKNLQPDVY